MDELADAVKARLNLGSMRFGKNAADLRRDGKAPGRRVDVYPTVLVRPVCGGRGKPMAWVGRGRGRKSTRPGANGLVELSPFEFLDRLADLVPPPRKHRHRYHGVFAPNHKLRRAVTGLAIGNIGKRRKAATGGQPTEGRCDTQAKPRSADACRSAIGRPVFRLEPADAAS